MTPVFILGGPRAKISALLFAILMGISRIYLVVHYPSDVITGMLVGIFAGCVAVLIARQLPRKWYQWDLRKQQPVGKHEINEGSAE